MRDRISSLLSAAALLLGLGLVLGLAGASPAHALYCGQRLVHRADSTERVRSICGEPDARSRRVETRSQSVARRINGVIVVQTVTVQVVIEEWAYDHGPNRLVRYLIFEDGLLTDERTGGYGSVEGDEDSKPSPRRKFVRD